MSQAELPAVLIVDDEPHVITLVRVTLEDESFRIIEATDGAQALAAAEETVPRLIFLDVRMPGVDGFEVCRRLRSDPRFSATKIVMLTASGQEADRTRGIAAGADEYLTKPFSPLALLNLVHSLLSGETVWPEMSSLPRRSPTLGT
ncbi:MAG TPA: response regulator [Methylomirabilota bacterium]|nr:response regulator [Methylomirabilota bacterium]